MAEIVSLLNEGESFGEEDPAKVLIFAVREAAFAVSGAITFDKAEGQLTIGSPFKAVAHTFKPSERAIKSTNAAALAAGAPMLRAILSLSRQPEQSRRLEDLKRQWFSKVSANGFHKPDSSEWLDQRIEADLRYG